MYLLWIFAALVVLIVGISYICFRMAFLAKKEEEEEYPLPPGEIYEPHREQMVGWMKETRALPHEAVSIRSFDGLTLRGNYYEYAPGAPVELMFHGYRGRAERDLCGGVQRCFALGRSALIVDQRACGHSEGRVITFGVNESRDCRDWVEFMIQKFGPEVKIVLTGISMGAATVTMAAAKPLPPQVIGLLADCGYTSARDIIQKVIADLKLPPKLAYPFVRLGAWLFGHFNLEATPPVEAMTTCAVPAIFIHGEADDFVPCEMSRENFAACTAEKALFTVPGAGHGLSYLIDREGYLTAVRAFAEKMGITVSK